MSTSIGYEHLKAIYLLKEAQAKNPLATSSAYVLPLMAMRSAQLAILEYTQKIGEQTDPFWKTNEWSQKPICDQLLHVFHLMGRKINLDKRVWKEVQALFQAIDGLQIDLEEIQKNNQVEIPETVKFVAVKFPILRSQAIAEEAVDLLLDMKNLPKRTEESVPAGR